MQATCIRSLQGPDIVGPIPEQVFEHLTDKNTVVAFIVNCLTAAVAISMATLLRFILVSLNNKLDRGEVVEGAVAVGEGVPGEAAKKGFRFLY